MNNIYIYQLFELWCHLIFDTWRQVKCVSWLPACHLNHAFVNCLSWDAVSVLVLHVRCACSLLECQLSESQTSGIWADSNLVCYAHCGYIIVMIWVDTAALSELCEYLFVCVCVCVCEPQLCAGLNVSTSFTPPPPPFFLFLSVLHQAFFIGFFLLWLNLIVLCFCTCFFLELNGA